MPLGLARDSMLDLAEMAKKVEDGEFKTSVEIEATSIDNDVLPIDTEKMIQLMSSEQQGASFPKPKQQPQQVAFAASNNTTSTAMVGSTSTNNTERTFSSSESLSTTTSTASTRDEMKLPDPLDTTATAVATTTGAVASTVAPPPTVSDDTDKDSIASAAESIDSSIGKSSAASASSTVTSDYNNSKKKKKKDRYPAYKEQRYTNDSMATAADFDSSYYYQQDYYSAYHTRNAHESQIANLLGGNKQSTPFWCCLAPWMNSNPAMLQDKKEEAYAKLRNENEPQEEEKKELDVMAYQHRSSPSPKSAVPTTSQSSRIARQQQQQQNQPPLNDDDETSTNSDMFGERLSEKDRQAVLARLRLAEPASVSKPPSSPSTTPATTGTSSPVSEQGDIHPTEQTEEGQEAAKENLNTAAKTGTKGLLNGIHIAPSLVQEQSPAKKPLQGILKRSSTKVSRNNLLPKSTNMKQKQTKTVPNDPKSSRRSLFPSYSEAPSKKKNLQISFSPMARVLSIKSHKDMDEGEKGEIWWQQSDYMEFRKTGRMITKAMLEGGSEIWLATNRSWQLPNQARSTTLKHATSLAERQAAKQKGNPPPRKDYEATRDKWWHKFGHSRRGLEHIASIDEGRQRQANVKQAIKSVVEENRRQKTFLREDADKLRMVSLQHTTWARDLALAAGASDADAVHTNFNDESRKSREFYLLKFSRAKQKSSSNLMSSKLTTMTTTTTNVPAFMRPAKSLAVDPNRLDANTMPQIRYRQKKRTSITSTTASVKLTSSTTATKQTTPSTVTPPPTAAAQTTTTTTSSYSSPVGNENQKAVPASTTVTSTTTMASLHDHTNSGGESMAKKAAGYASGEGGGDMSAVLSGMGAIPQSATASVGGP